MNWGYLHLAINHFPIIGTIIGTLILLVGYGFKNQTVKLTGLGTIVFAALMAIPTILTGDPAKEGVESLPGVAANMIETHENAAYVGLWILLLLGLISLLALLHFWKKKKFARILVMVAMMLSMVTSGVMVYVGRTAGKIRHTEFSKQATVQTDNTASETEDGD